MSLILNIGVMGCIILKVWNINYIFEQVHHIDRHEMTIDAVSLCTEKLIAITATRGCVGIWDMLTGTLTSKLVDSQLGAIVTHATVITSGEYIIAAESGNVIYWKVATESVVYKEHQKDIMQIVMYDDETKCIVVSKNGNGSDTKARCITRSFPEGTKQFTFQFPYRYFKKIVVTSDNQSFVAYGYEKLKDTIFVYHAETGELVNKILIKYPNFKEVSNSAKNCQVVNLIIVKCMM